MWPADHRGHGNGQDLDLGGPGPDASGRDGCVQRQRGKPGDPGSLSQLSHTIGGGKHRSGSHGRAGRQRGGLTARYQSSKVISEAAGHIELDSTDPVSKVASFYKNALKSRGWRILSAGKNAGSTDIVAMLGTTGVGISISHADPAGTAILVLECDC